ncbi:MAG: hypothetical protein ACPGU4_10175 [Flavobacteriales bacterium]
MSLTGAGIALAPWKLATAESSIQRFRLPPASVHIPHGNFAASETETHHIQEFDLKCSVQHFMRNGIEPNENDLTVFSLSRENETLLISSTKRGYSVLGEINGIVTEILPGSVCLSSKTHQLHVSSKELFVQRK